MLAYEVGHFLKLRALVITDTSLLFLISVFADVYEDLETNGKITMKTEDECKLLLGERLKCHKCNFVSNTIPNLKKHVLTHFTE